MVSAVFQTNGLDLSDHQQYVSTNGYDSGCCSGSPTFLLYINNLNQAIKFCKAHHFADDTNLLYLGKSIKKHNKFVNIDLNNLVNWLNANKLSLNVNIPEMVIFKSQRKFNDIVKIKLIGKRIYPTASVS